MAEKQPERQTVSVDQSVSQRPNVVHMIHADLPWYVQAGSRKSSKE
ncbi:hypothetical protein AB0L13_46680 [Saccharopolyspora shandongensis]